MLQTITERAIQEKVKLCLLKKVSRNEDISHYVYSVLQSESSAIHISKLIVEQIYLGDTFKFAIRKYHSCTAEFS